MTPYYDDGQVVIYHGDCRDVLPALGPVDAIVTDPPYGLEFMGKEWDSLRGEPEHWNDWQAEPGRYHNDTNFLAKGNRPRYGGNGVAMQTWHEAWAREAFRVLKPGGHMLAFGGTRTHHRLMVAIEDAGFEIRDCLMWLYGSGFPKSHNIAKALDKLAGKEGNYGAPKSAAHAGWIDRGRMRGDEGHEGYQRPWMKDEAAVDKNARVYEGATDLARQWDGWGTALKPAYEPIILARKPLIGTVAANVTEYGTGAINIDGCRIEGAMDGTWGATQRTSIGYHGTDVTEYQTRQHPSGRWPANILLDEDAAALLDDQSPTSTSTGGYRGKGSHGRDGWGMMDDPDKTPLGYGDTGGASRFFYTAKASRKERGEGNDHPTVKPLALMRYLCRLITPPGGVVLDPFLGSGSTAIAARSEGFRVVGVEQDAHYIDIAVERLQQAVLPLEMTA